MGVPHTRSMETRSATVIALANQKGGVTKTTTAVNLATILSLIGFRVLVIDCDPQGHATFSLGYNQTTLTRTLYSVLLGHLQIKEVVLPTYFHPHTNTFFDPREKAIPHDDT